MILVEPQYFALGRLEDRGNREADDRSHSLEKVGMCGSELAIADALLDQVGTHLAAEQRQGPTPQRVHIAQGFVPDMLASRIAFGILASNRSTLPVTEL